jgi:hypothetical protein
VFAISQTFDRFSRSSSIYGLENKFSSISMATHLMNPDAWCIFQNLKRRNYKLLVMNLVIIYSSFESKIKSLVRII